MGVGHAGAFDRDVDLAEFGGAAQVGGVHDAAEKRGVGAAREGERGVGAGVIPSDIEKEKAVAVDEVGVIEIAELELGVGADSSGGGGVARGDAEPAGEEGALKVGELGAVVAVGEPEVGGGHADVRAGVGVVEELFARADGFAEKFAGAREARGIGKGVGTRLGVFDGVEQHGEVGGAVFPVARTLIPSAVERVVAQGEGQGGHHGGELGAQFVGRVVADGEGGENEAAVHDGVPVVGLGAGEGGALGEGGVEGVAGEGGAELGAAGFAQPVVQPIVTDGDGGGHLGGVEKVVGIPIGKGGDGGEFGPGAFRVAFVAEEAVGEGEGADLGEGGAALGEQAGADEFVRDDGLCEKPVGVEAQAFQQGVEKRIARGEFAEFGLAGGGEEKAGVRLCRHVVGRGRAGRGETERRKDEKRGGKNSEAGRKWHAPDPARGNDSRKDRRHAHVRVYPASCKSGLPSKKSRFTPACITPPSRSRCEITRAFPRPRGRESGRRPRRSAIGPTRCWPR